MNHFLAEDEKKQVSECVRVAELQTSGEIVPMIVRRSSMIGHVLPQIFSILLILILLMRMSMELFFHELHYEWITMGALILSAPLALWLQRWPFMQRIMTPRSDLDFEVFERAQLEFYQSNIHKTKDDTGVLIFISLMERRCVVLAGESIASKMPKDTWDEVVRLAVSGIKNKKPAEGLCSAVQLCGNILAKYFAKPAGDKNELPNAVIIKE